MQLSHKLGLIGALYIAEGLPFGFFTQALPVLLREAGLSLTQIGLTSLLALPWALKFLWAPTVDRSYSHTLGRRRSWLLPVQGLTVLVLLWAATLAPAVDMAWIFFAVLLCNLLAATLDIATDGLAVSLLKPAERGLGNGVQVAGYRVGMVLSGGLLLVVFEQLGWAGSFLVMAALIALLTLPVLLWQEPVTVTKSPRLDVTWQFALLPGVAAWLGAIFVYKLGDAVGAGMVRPFLVDHGMRLGEIGAVVGILGFVASLAGALLGGWLTGRLGGYRAVLLFGLLQVAGILAFAGVASIEPPRWLLYLVIVIENGVGGMVTAAMFTLMMFACRERTEGSDYTLQACVFVIATGVAVSVSGALAEHLGYVSYFLIGAVCALLGLLPIAIAWLRGGFRAVRLPVG